MAKLFCGGELVDESWHPLDDREPPPYVPPIWTGPHVFARIIAAWQTLNKMPWRSPFPRKYGPTWPVAYRLEWHDLLVLVGSGELDAVQREQNRVRLQPSAREISEMEQALHWPLTYLRRDRHVLIVNTVARIKSFDGDLAREMRRKRYQGNAEQWTKLSWQLCETIAEGLIRQCVVVF